MKAVQQMLRAKRQSVKQAIVVKPPVPERKASVTENKNKEALPEPPEPSEEDDENGWEREPEEDVEEPDTPALAAPEEASGGWLGFGATMSLPSMTSDPTQPIRNGPTALGRVRVRVRVKEEDSLAEIKP